MRSFLPYLFLLILSCNDKKPRPFLNVKRATSKQKIIVDKNYSDSCDYQLNPFTLVKYYPNIMDTAFFIKELKNNCHITGVFFRWKDSALHETINIFRQINLYGTNKRYYLIEYDWHGNEPNVEFPWKKQFLFDSSGILIKSFQALRVDLLNIFPNQHPFLVEVVATSKGNGGHRIYKIAADTTDNIYEGYYDYDTQTYDAGEDKWVYEPNELTILIKDFNKDGFNDIAFVGKLVLTQGLAKGKIWYDFETTKGKDTVWYSIGHPFKKLPLRYVFLYNAKTAHFLKSNKYSIKNPFE